MKILGREIAYGKIAPLGFSHPSASLIGVCQKVRQEFFNPSPSGRSLPPSIITIEMTYACNLRCKTCWFYGENGIFKNKKAVEQLDLKELKKLADDVSIFKPYIYLTGGEPLLNRSTIPFLKYGKMKGIAMGMVTNGTLLTRENCSSLLDADLDFLTVSLDGPEKIHNKIRGKKCFERAVEGIRNMVKAKKDRGKKLPIITLNCTISEDNYKSLKEVVKIGRSLGVDITALQHQCFLRKGTIERHQEVFRREFGESNQLVEGYESTSGNRINSDELYENIGKIKGKGRDSLRLFQDFSKEQLRDYYGKEKALNSRCITPWFSAIIKPNGDVTPCLGHVVGNIKTKPFIKIWNGEEFKKFRRILKQKRYFPGCIRCCGFFFDWK